MDAPEQLLTLKASLRYLEQVHGLRFSVVAMRARRAKGTAPEYFIPAGGRELRTTAALLDTWVAQCRANPARRGKPVPAWLVAHELGKYQLRPQLPRESLLVWHRVALWALSRLPPPKCDQQAKP